MSSEVSLVRVEFLLGSPPMRLTLVEPRALCIIASLPEGSLGSVKLKLHTTRSVDDYYKSSISVYLLH